MRASVLGFYKALFEEDRPESLQQKFLDLLLELQNVERGSLWAKRPEGGYLCIHSAGPQSESIKGLVVDEDKPSIVGWVIKNGRMTIAEAGRDQRHYKKAEEGLKLKSNLILCYPLILKDGSIFGAVQLIDTSAEGNRLNLDKDYLDLLQTMVDLGSLALSRTLDYAEQVAENQRLKQAIKQITSPDAMVGADNSFLTAARTAANYAGTDFPVLITGESGTGKEVMARELHRLSLRKAKPFFAQNCSAIPDNLLESELFGYRKGAFTGADKDKIGLFEAADGGTVFLDEIGDMPLNLQARLLRVLQNQEVKPLGSHQVRKVDVRIISATNQDLPAMIAANRFREDLFFRLNVLPLNLPPLRERGGDVVLLAEYFMKRESQRLGLEPKDFSDSALDALRAHAWPGNVRELQNMVKYLLATVNGQAIHSRDLPLELAFQPASARSGQAAGAQAAPLPLPGSITLDGLSWEEMEKAYVERLLETNKWNISRAARQAKVNRSTFDSRLKKMGFTKRA